MIEFKAECGHTVRAKDQDAGSVVRCSYCGRMATVPNSQPEDDLGFLLEEVNQASQSGSLPAIATKRRHPKKQAGRRRPRGEFNPFAFSLKLCYAAALIIVVVVVGHKYVVPLFSEGRTGPPIASAERRTSPKRTIGGRQQRSSNSLGLASLQGAKGLYVASVPPGAGVHYALASGSPSGRILGASDCKFIRADASIPKLSPGRYVVEVVLPYNDKVLKRYPGYSAFRDAIESAGSNIECEQLLEEYFIPDGATRVFIDDTGEQIYLVRQYREVIVPREGWAAVRSLFLPRVPHANGEGFSIEALISRKCFPQEKTYKFDNEHVRDELRHYGVPETERQYVTDALSHIGVIPYVTPRRGTLLFMIGVENGEFTRRQIQGAPP